MSTYISIIIPAYNEEQNIKQGVLDEVIKYLQKQKYSWELLIINDGSNDNTHDLLNNFSSKNKNVVYINNPHMGKAATIMTGANKAQGKYIIYSDLDQSTPITEIDKFINLFQKGADIVIGSRAGRKGAPLFRQILAYGNVVLRSLFLRLPYKDTQCGFKGFTLSSAKNIFNIMSPLHPFRVIQGPAVNAGFDMEILFIARKIKYKIVEVPVEWHHKETRRVSFVRDALASIYELLLIRYRSITNAYKFSNAKP